MTTEILNCRHLFLERLDEDVICSSGVHPCMLGPPFLVPNSTPHKATSRVHSVMSTPSKSCFLDRRVRMCSCNTTVLCCLMTVMSCPTKRLTSPGAVATSSLCVSRVFHDKLVDIYLWRPKEIGYPQCAAPRAPEVVHHKLVDICLWSPKEIGYLLVESQGNRVSPRHRPESVSSGY